MISAAESDENESIRKRASEAVQKYFAQLTVGCGREKCTNKMCASNPQFERLSTNQAAALAIKMAKEKAILCVDHRRKVDDDDEKQPCTSSSGAKHNHDDDNDDEYFTMNDDDNDVIVPSSSSSSSRVGSAASASAAAAAAASSTELKSMNDALNDAVKFVKEMNEQKHRVTDTAGDKSSSHKKSLYLNEKRIENLIKKCKQNLADYRNREHSESKMEVDGATTNTSEMSASSPEILACYKPLFSALQTVFQSFTCLSNSFCFKNPSDAMHMSLNMPSSPPFNIDFNSIRRSYTLLFAGQSLHQSIVDELEKCLDMAVYALCFNVRMLLKPGSTNTLTETQLEQILHAILVVNELPLLEDPKYMDRCAKIFYATVSELPVSESVKLVRLWSKWHADELRVYLNKAQQYITVVVISKNLDEENNRNQNDDDDEEEFNETEKCMHRNEGIAGAVGYMRLIYYASVFGGRLDSPEQIAREHEIEAEEMRKFEDSLANETESSPIFVENMNMTTCLLDPLEKELGIRPVDCRETKIPHDQFINEVANKFIDIQHDYVEYTKHLQNLESELEERTRAGQQANNSRNSSSKTPRKPIFSFLANSFFLVLGKKNLGLYYDNKIKMMRERRNNIMMSLIEGRMPTPYFKIRLTRQNLLSEALSLIELQDQENPATLRKQLFVEFENEQGIDQGGVSKEFFQLAIDELLNKGFTFFTLDEKSNYYWFTPTTLETEKEFRLVGILFGIAIYNNVLLDVQFPPIFFRKLFGKLGTLEDLFYSHHDLHQGLNSLLEFQGTNEEFENTFMQTFQISLTDNFGTIVNFNLKEDGDKIPVTKENRKEFVDLYADFILNKGIDESFKAFRRGFLKMVINSPLLSWYSPEELEILLCGTKVLDWKSLEHSTSYDSGFDPAHKYIKQFWEVFEEFTDEEKKLFLKFTTGTDRCPHGGLSELKLTIARNGPDTEKLPTAHTCFNVLLLPEYSSKQKLKEKLIKAIQYSRGFGLS